MLGPYHFLFSLFIVAFISPLYSSGDKDIPSEKGGESIVITDSRGEEIRLSSPPEKIISLGPNITETIYALDRGSLLIGRTDYCNFPEEALSVPTVGTLQEPNIETIISLEPDLVLASTHVSSESLHSLTDLGIPVALFYGPADFSGLEEVISGCAALLGAEEEGAELMADITSRKEKVQASVDGEASHPAVYYALGFGDGGDWTAGKGTFIDSMISLAGGDNIAKQEGWSYSKEMLVEEDPDIIILASGEKELFLSLPIYKDLSASVKGRVYEINENLLVRQGPRLIDGLEELYAILDGSFE